MRNQYLKGKPITCKLCGQGGGTLVKVGEEYHHRDCTASTERREDSSRGGTRIVLARPKLWTVGEHMKAAKLAKRR